MQIPNPFIRKQSNESYFATRRAKWIMNITIIVTLVSIFMAIVTTAQINNEQYVICVSKTDSCNSIPFEFWLYAANSYWFGLFGFILCLIELAFFSINNEIIIYHDPDNA